MLNDEFSEPPATVQRRTAMREQAVEAWARGEFQPSHGRKPTRPAHAWPFALVRWPGSEGLSLHISKDLRHP